MVATAFIMGFAGSLHCAGMCSPLAMAVSGLHPRSMLRKLVYNAGRILIYGLLGLIVGAAGTALPFTDFQNLFSVFLGIMLLLAATPGLPVVRIPGLTYLFGRLSVSLKTLFASFLKQKNYLSVFVLGSLNGLLPCGLSFLALSFCLTLKSSSESFVYMILFGAGTLPVMLGMTTIFHFIVKTYQISFRKLTLTMLFFSGILLIGRVFFFQIDHLSQGEQKIVDIILCR